jgi:DNA-binding NtrC family response regulator
LTATVLVVDDDKAIREGLARAISASGYAARPCDSVAAARAALGSGGAVVDCVLLDIRLKDGDGLELLAEIRKSHPKLPVIMATAYGDSDRTIQAMKEGAFDYLTKPFDLDVLLSTIARAVKTSSATPRKPVNTPTAEAQVPSLVGASARMLEVWKAIGRAAGSDAPVLITGESGTGKELVAHAIHENGARRAQPFVAVNIAALPATLVESELFGHEKGAFTGATARREGRFEVASRGTLFLDEIGDLELPLQTKLLRVLQDGTFERVGSQTQLSSQARVIAATSRPVEPKAAGTTMREDLFYRLGVVRIEVPPLRERRSDVPLLVEAFLRKRAQAVTGSPRRAVSDRAMERLEAHDWPGNVRELLHVLERACVMSTADVIDEHDLGISESPRTQGSGSVSPPAAEPESLDLHAAVEALERSFIDRALRRSGGNRAEAARLLGIARPQLYAKMKDLGIEPPEAKGRGGGS